MTGQASGFTFPEYHQWRRDRFDVLRKEMSNRLRELADELDRERVLYDDPAYVPADALRDGHYGDEVTVAASIASIFMQGINHAGRNLDNLISAAHECAVLRWAPDQQALTDTTRALERLVDAANAVLDKPSGKVARDRLRSIVGQAAERNVP